MSVRASPPAAAAGTEPAPPGRASADGVNARVDHVDIAKGISIVLVALFHSRLQDFMPALIDAMSLFRMPLFFFLSGVFFTWRSRPASFLLKKSDALLKPYFATLTALALMASLGLPAPDAALPVPEFAGILYGNGDVIRLVPLWFLTHLFAVYCAAYLVFRYTALPDSPSAVKLGVLALMVGVGPYVMEAFSRIGLSVASATTRMPGLPFSLDIIFLSSAFFFAGAMMRSRVIAFRPRLSWALVAAGLFLAIQLLTQAHIDLNKRIYQSPTVATLGAVGGIYLILFASFHLQNRELARRVLLIFGNASLFILVFHSYIGRALHKVLDTVLPHQFELAFAVLVFLLSITVPLGLKVLVARVDVLALFYFPLSSNPLVRRLLRKRAE